MKFEILTEQKFNRKFGSFPSCENDWEDIDEVIVDVLLNTNYKEHTEFVKNRILEGSCFKVCVGFIRLKTNKQKCPLCGGSFEEMQYSLSIVDNNTMICSECGLREQLERFTGSYER